MKFKNEEARKAWEMISKVSSDPVGMGFIGFCERWTSLMEEEISKGMEVDDIADECSEKADMEDISATMFLIAVNILCEVWKYEKELKVWRYFAFDA